MTLSMSDVASGLFILTATVFVVYLGFALHGMRQATIRMIGVGLVVVALALVYMQISYIRLRLFRIEYIVDGGTASGSKQAEGGDGRGGSGTMRSYALKLDGVASKAAQSARRTTPQETMFTVSCTLNNNPVNRSVRYTDVRRVAVVQGGGANALRQDVISGKVRYMLAAGDTWRIVVAPSDELPVSTTMLWYFDMARVDQEGALTVVPDVGDTVHTSTCIIPAIVMPFSSSSSSSFDTLLAASSATAPFMLHAWAYGWQT